MTRVGAVALVRAVLPIAALTAALVGCATPVDVRDTGVATPGIDAPRDTASHPPAAGLETTVTRIVDGDTLHVSDLGVRVRLIGIDTPETVHPNRGVECFGREASAHLAELVPPGTPVVVGFDVERTDRYDRPLGYVWRASDGLFVNLAMIENGFAQAYTVPPNVRYSDRFVAAQRRARDADRGLWSACRE